MGRPLSRSGRGQETIQPCMSMSPSQSRPWDKVTGDKWLSTCTYESGPGFRSLLSQGSKGIILISLVTWANYLSEVLLWCAQSYVPCRVWHSAWYTAFLNGRVLLGEVAVDHTLTVGQPRWAEVRRVGERLPSPWEKLVGLQGQMQLAQRAPQQTSPLGTWNAFFCSLYECDPFDKQLVCLFACILKIFI